MRLLTHAHCLEIQSLIHQRVAPRICRCSQSVAQRARTMNSCARCLLASGVAGSRPYWGQMSAPLNISCGEASQSNLITGLSLQPLLDGYRNKKWWHHDSNSNMMEYYRNRSEGHSMIVKSRICGFLRETGLRQSNLTKDHSSYKTSIVQWRGDKLYERIIGGY